MARGLLGALLVHETREGRCSGRIVETEAYLGREDRAAHSWRGVTPRTQVIYGPSGHAYVYLIYGMYECLNIVAEPDGVPGCVLIRALEPVEGIALMQARRPRVRQLEDLARGPGKLTKALAIGRALNGADLTRKPLWVEAGPPVAAAQIVATPRVGITHCADWPLRFHLRGNPHVSRGPAPA